MISVSRAAIACLTLFATVPLSAGAATFDDRAAFLAAISGAVEHSDLTADFSLTGNINTSYPTFTDKFGSAPYVAVNGIENFDVSVTYAGTIFAFGMDVYEPAASTATFNGCNATCFDSTFEITILSGSTVIDSAILMPDDDVLDFFGITSTVGFDTIRIRETTGDIDNEFFGNFISTPHPVPLPPAMALMIAGLGGLAFVRRRRG